MVDIGRKSSDAGKLRERVRLLTKELDDIEHRHEEGVRTLREAIVVIGGMVPKEQTPAVGKAFVAFRKVASARKMDYDAFGEALDELKSAIVAEPTDYGPGASAQAKETAQAKASRHVSLALLHGLRLGDENFDPRLDKAIDEIGNYVSSGAVRPAMAVLADLLDEFRVALNSRLHSAEQALKDIVSEVLRTETELIETFTRATSELESDGKGQADQMSSTLASLLEDINGAPDMETLKMRALSHIRTLRDQIKTRRAMEVSKQQQIMSEMDQVREALDETKRHMSSFEKLTEKLSREAMTDPLTKIWNKRAFSQRLATVMQHRGSSPLFLIVFDIDFFKGINDNFGHKAGDRALETIAKFANSALRKEDTLFRYAGDEFVILMTDIDLPTAQAIAERVRQAAEKIRFTYGGKGEIRLTLSIGLAAAKAGDTPETLFERADQSLLEAKRQGRNRVVTAD